jgi:hypothetical protein
MMKLEKNFELRDMNLARQQGVQDDVAGLIYLLFN